MGLDAVELVMEIEDEFSIQVPDSWYEQMRTVDDMCRVVASLLGENFHPICRCPRAFCTLRQGFMSLGQPREVVRTKTSVESLLAGGSIRERWQLLRDATGYHLPDLQRPHGLMAVLILIPLAALFAAVAAAISSPQIAWTSAAWLLILAVLPTYCFVATVLTRPLATAIPANCASVGELVRTTLRWNDVVPSVESSHPESKQIYTRVRRIISEVLNIPLEDIHPDSRFIQDLRMG